MDSSIFVVMLRSYLVKAIFPHFFHKSVFNILILLGLVNFVMCASDSYGRSLSPNLEAREITSNWHPERFISTKKSMKRCDDGSFPCGSISFNHILIKRERLCG